MHKTVTAVVIILLVLLLLFYLMLTQHFYSLNLKVYKKTQI